MNFQCDLYCYADVSGGWTTHVAETRRVREPNIPYPDIQKLSDEEWTKAYAKYHADLDSIPLKPIGLPYDGKTFNDPTLEDFRARVAWLMKMGYKAPKSILEDIDEEIAYRDAGKCT